MLQAKGYFPVRVNGSQHVFVKPGAAAFSLPVHHGKAKYAYVR
jgi:predicted RNA binding protein YcfA (HicA-like mRNA interferase family)